MKKNELGANEKARTTSERQNIVGTHIKAKSKELADSSLAGVLPAWPHRNYNRPGPRGILDLDQSSSFLIEESQDQKLGKQTQIEQKRVKISLTLILVLLLGDFFLPVKILCNCPKTLLLILIKKPFPDELMAYLLPETFLLILKLDKNY